jgi:hypothetical protein
LKALAAGLTGPAGIGLAVGVASSLLVKFGGDLFGTGKAAKAAKDDLENFNKGLETSRASALSTGLQLQKFVDIAKNGNLPLQQRNEALSRANDILGKYGEKLTLANVQTKYANELVQKYTESLIAQALAAQYADRIATLLIRQAEAQNKVTTAQLEYNKAHEALANRPALSLREQELGRGLPFIIQRDNALQTLTDSEKEYGRITKEVTDLTKQFNTQALKSTELFGDIGKKPLKIAKVKQDKPLDLVFQAIVPKLDKTLQNPVLEALKRDQKDILTESEQIGKLINDSIAKNIKPLPKIVSPEVTKQLAEQQKALESQLSFAQQAASQISDSFSQAFDDILAGQNVFKAVGEAVKGLVLDIAKAAIRALIFRAILNAIVPGGAKALDLGGVANLLPGRANGGPVSGKSPYIIGERGPELFVPSVSGNVIPNNRLSSFTGRPAFASGSGGGRTIVRGNDILLASARTQRSQNRVNA